MAQALYLNGVYEGVLEEIVAAQAHKPGVVCYLQPYSEKQIRLLVESRPSKENQIALYISLTDSLSVVSYRASIVGWQDKRQLSPSDFNVLNAHIGKYQPQEKEIYREAGKGRLCVNLIAVVDVEKLASPIPVSAFVKTSDRLPLKVRTRAGLWSVVEEQPGWLGAAPTVVAEQLDDEYRRKVDESLRLSSAARKARLENAPKLPQVIQVIARAFRRNPDVGAEVLARAKGTCERCGSSAPFNRKKDGTPYLEIHHRITLAEGGEDTVKNAIALCPNCHRYFHYGV